jgi:hypothetical protein
MLLRVGALMVVAALGCTGGGSGAPDAALPCAVDQAPADQIAACGTPPPQCCNLPWCGPDPQDSSWFCSTHGGANWCCVCADTSGSGTPRWIPQKLECGLGQHDAGPD